MGQLAMCKRNDRAYVQRVPGKVSEISNTEPNVKIWLFLETAIFCFACCCSLILIDLAGLVAAFWDSVFASIFTSIS